MRILLLLLQIVLQHAPKIPFEAEMMVLAEVHAAILVIMSRAAAKYALSERLSHSTIFAFRLAQFSRQHK